MKRIYLRLFLLAFLVLSVLTLQAQRPGGNRGSRGGRDNFDFSKIPAIGVISGTVIDSLSGEPIEFATIKIQHRMADTILTGGITNAKGKFYIENIKLGPQIVEIAFMGYETKVIRGVRLGRQDTEKDLGTIFVYPSTFLLNAIEVKANKSFMTNAIDRKIYDPSQLIESETGSVSDILENIPSIEIDMDGNLSLRGSSSVRVLIDGRPSRFTGEDLTALLEQLPGNQIERIEVITNPSAKYDPEGTAGIINIVMKKNALKGFNGSLTFGYGGKDRVNAAANLNYKIKKVNLFGNYSTRQGTYDGSGSTFRENFSDLGNTFLEQTNTSERGRNGQFIKFGLDYSLNPKTTLTLQSTVSDRSGPRNQLINSRIFDENDNLLEASIRDSRSNSDGKSLNVQALLTKKFSGPTHELLLDVNYTKGDNKRFQDFQETFFDEEGIPLFNDPEISRNTTFGDRNEFTFSADYSKPITKNSKLELGFKSVIRDEKSDFRAFNFDHPSDAFLDDDLLSNDFLYEEQIHALYATYGNKIRNFGFQLGLRAEQVFTDSKLLTSNGFFENKYFSLYPSIHLSYSLKNENELQLSYSRRVRRPRQRQLNPFVDYSDPQNLRVGNPFLLPEYSNSMELGFGKYWKSSSLTTSIYFKNTNGVISRIKTVDSTGVSTTFYENLDNRNSYGLEFVYVTQFAKRFSLNSSFNLFATNINASNISLDLRTNSFSYSSRVALTSKLWKGASLQLSGRYRSSRVITQGEISPFFVTSLGFKQSLMENKASISINTRDLFNSMEFDFETSGANFYQRSSRKRSNRVVFVSFSFRFGEIQRMRRNRKNGSQIGEGGEEIEID